MFYENLLTNLYKYLVGSEDYNNNIIHKHNRKLDKIGEFSFSTDTLLFSKNNSKGTISNTIQTCSVEEANELLVEESKGWLLQISKCLRIENSIHLFLDRELSFKTGITETLHQKDKYGSQIIRLSKKVCLLANPEEQQEYSNLNLSQLRLLLIKDVVLRLLEYNKFDEESLPNVSVLLSLNGNKASEKVTILCGAVLSSDSKSKPSITADEFYRKRTIDMRLMAEHKYGLRITSDTKWQTFFEKLGEAAVRIELLQNNPSRTVTINTNDPTASSSKGASFILYNCARLATLFKEFDKRVAAKMYPPLPPIDNINLKLLTQFEEWELLFLYILQFPHIVNSCIKDIVNGKINLHCLCNMLSSMCSIFSVYYRRVRVLIEPRSHLFETLHARIYLLKAVEQVLHNGLYLLNIEPVKQM